MDREAWHQVAKVLDFFLYVIYQRPPQALGFLGGASGKEPSCQCKRCKRLGFDPWVRDDSLEEGMATSSSILTWRIPMVRGAYWAMVPRFTKSWTQLKQISTHVRLWPACFFPGKQAR